MQLSCHQVLQQQYSFSETFFLIFYHRFSVHAKRIHIHDKDTYLCRIHLHKQSFVEEYLLFHSGTFLLFQDSVLCSVLSFFSCNSTAFQSFTDCLITASECFCHFFLCFIRMFFDVGFQFFRVYFFKASVKRLITYSNPQKYHLILTKVI